AAIRWTMLRCTAPSPGTTLMCGRCSNFTGFRSTRQEARVWLRCQRHSRLRPRRAREDKLMIRQLDEKVMVSGQVAPNEVSGLAEQGVTMLVNNRPDGEEAGQPLAGEIEDAAAAAGIGYRFVPIIRGI